MRGVSGGQAQLRGDQQHAVRGLEPDCRVCGSGTGRGQCLGVCVLWRHEYGVVQPDFGVAQRHRREHGRSAGRDRLRCVRQPRGRDELPAGRSAYVAWRGGGPVEQRQSGRDGDHDGRSHKESSSGADGNGSADRRSKADRARGYDRRDFEQYDAAERADVRHESGQRLVPDGDPLARDEQRASLQYDRDGPDLRKQYGGCSAERGVELPDVCECAAGAAACVRAVGRGSEPGNDAEPVRVQLLHAGFDVRTVCRGRVRLGRQFAGAVAVGGLRSRLVRGQSRLPESGGG